MSSNVAMIPQLHSNQMDLKYFTLLIKLILMAHAVTCSVEGNGKYTYGIVKSCSYFSMKTNSYCKPLIEFYNSGTSNDVGDKDAKLCKLS